MNTPRKTSKTYTPFKLYQGMIVNPGVDPVKLMEARKDAAFQIWMLQFLQNKD